MKKPKNLKLTPRRLDNDNEHKFDVNIHSELSFKQQQSTSFKNFLKDFDDNDEECIVQIDEDDIDLVKDDRQDENENCHNDDIEYKNSEFLSFNSPKTRMINNIEKDESSSFEKNEIFILEKFK
jgi:hypothetical protein